MTLAMKSLCESHNDIRTLMTALELPVSDWEDKWIDVYLDISSKLLDICNAFSSELSRLNQQNLPLKCALHNLDYFFLFCSAKIHNICARAKGQEDEDNLWTLCFGKRHISFESS